MKYRGVVFGKKRLSILSNVKKKILKIIIIFDSHPEKNNKTTPTHYFKYSNNYFPKKKFNQLKSAPIQGNRTLRNKCWVLISEIVKLSTYTLHHTPKICFENILMGSLNIFRILSENSKIFFKYFTSLLDRKETLPRLLNIIL